MRKKAATKMPRQRREKVTYCTITPAAWNRLRSFVFQPQNGQPLAFADCLALEERVHTTWKVMSQISDTLENSCFEINGLRKRP
jgi:hypothetical protein